MNYAHLRQAFLLRRPYGCLPRSYGIAIRGTESRIEYREASRGPRHRRCIKAARRQIKRDIPPAVLYRGERQTRLTSDLDVHVQSIGGVFPCLH